MVAVALVIALVVWTVLSVAVGILFGRVTERPGSSRWQDCDVPARNAPRIHLG